MYLHEERTKKWMRASVTAAFAVGLALSPLALAAPVKKDSLDASATREVTGEVVDLMCYIDHGAMGAKHEQCAQTCIKSGGPVGIVSDGKAYLVIGEHKPMNDELAPLAGKTVTLRGKMAHKGGMTMLENAEIVKK